MLPGQALDRVHVDAPVVPPDAVMDDVEPLAREVGRGAVAQVPAGGQRHAQDTVAGLQKCQEHDQVGLAPGVGLDVGEGAAEEPPRPLDRQALDDVDVQGAAVVAAPRIALHGLVGEHRPLGHEHRPTDDVLRRDELDLVVLAPQLVGDRRVDLGVGGGETRGEVAGVGLGQGPPYPARRGAPGLRQSSASAVTGVKSR